MPDAAKEAEEKAKAADEHVYRNLMTEKKLQLHVSASGKEAENRRSDAVP